MSADKNTVSGNTSMLILQLLSEKDRYGYEMIETLRKRSKNVFELKAGTLYPLLHGLEAEGSLTVYEQEFQGKVRKYYQITRRGLEQLEEKKREWKDYRDAVTQVIGGVSCGMG